MKQTMLSSTSVDLSSLFTHTHTHKADTTSYFSDGILKSFTRIRKDKLNSSKKIKIASFKKNKLKKTLFNTLFNCHRPGKTARFDNEPVTSKRTP